MASKHKENSPALLFDRIKDCPFEWRDKFPPAAGISAERQQTVMKKWKEELFS
ncbi:MAG: hypothetical protein ACREQ2_17790 [Candidatus Binatia bacterium]